MFDRISFRRIKRRMEYDKFWSIFLEHFLRNFLRVTVRTEVFISSNFYPSFLMNCNWLVHKKVGGLFHFLEAFSHILHILSFLNAVFVNLLPSTTTYPEAAPLTFDIMIRGGASELIIYYIGTLLYTFI